MKLTDNFSLSEFQASKTARKNNIKEQFEKLPINIVASLHELCLMVLEPLRVEYQKPLTITSGYRCLALNTKVGGSKNSDHMRGMAADVTCDNPEQLYELAIALSLPYKQLIWYRSQNFVHFSYDANKIDRESWINK